MVWRPGGTLGGGVGHPVNFELVGVEGCGRGVEETNDRAKGPGRQAFGKLGEDDFLCGLVGPDPEGDGGRGPVDSVDVELGRRLETGDSGGESADVVTDGDADFGRLRQRQADGRGVGPVGSAEGQLERSRQLGLDRRDVGQANTDADRPFFDKAASRNNCPNTGRI